jgi:phi13 family phage major tail protein
MDNDAVVEFRGVDNLVYALVTVDTSANYTTGTVKMLAPVAQIAKTIDQSSDTKYYDNVAMIVIQGSGKDTITTIVPALGLATLAELTGQYRDTDTGGFSEGSPNPPYVALGYRLRLTDGTYRYVWRHKGQFSVPEETSATENAGTDTNNQSLIYTGVSTVHKFTKTGKSAKALVVDERDDLADLSTFFASVTTIDTLQEKE